MRILITGGAGFIGSNLIHHWLQQHPEDYVYNLDALTYAGNLLNLQEVEQSPNYHFLHADLRQAEKIHEIFSQHQIDGVIHLAAESHVDRSISRPAAFIETNVLGTFHLLEAARRYWGNSPTPRFHHVSTDEVFGSLGPEGAFQESTPYAPNSPYSATKASSDHLVRAYHHTYGLNTVTTNCSNNYGPYQFPEKLIPLLIHNCVEQRPLPVYGDGSNIRDWLHVTDHCQALDRVFHQGKPGETYNIGSSNEWKNLDLVHLICDLLDAELGRTGADSCRELITFVKDRPGHDQRYAIDPRKMEKELNWRPQLDFQTGLQQTIRWYLTHHPWVEQVTSGAYREYYRQHYLQ